MHLDILPVFLDSIEYLKCGKLLDVFVDLKFWFCEH